jgi:hypothetical protein
MGIGGALGIIDCVTKVKDTPELKSIFDFEK